MKFSLLLRPLLPVRQAPVTTGAWQACVNCRHAWQLAHEAPCLGCSRNPVHAPPVPAMATNNWQPAR